MVILLQVNKITFEKSENLKKNLISQNLAKILTENCCFLKKKIFFHGFSKIAPEKIPSANLDYIVSNMIR